MISRHTTQRLIGFIHHLRNDGYIIGLSEVLDLMASLDERLLGDINHSRNIMRSLTCHSAAEWKRFDDLFLEYWKAQEIDPDAKPLDSGNVQGSGSSATAGFSGSAGEAPEVVSIEELQGSGAGRQSTISKADFRFLTDQHAMREIEHLTDILALLLRRRLRRRTTVKRRGRQLAIRPTLRRNLSYGGLPVHTFFKARPPEPVNLLILHDVSHSMAWNNPLLFRFVRGLVRTFKESEVFVFHTELYRATPYFREQSLESMQRRLEARNHLWMGGTCIATSLQHFNRDYAARYLRSNSLVLILSDGFDTDSPEFLATEIAQIKRRSRKLIWLNPMIGREGYNPDQPTMRPVRKMLDYLASANNLDALQQTIQYIGQCNR